MPCLTGAAGSSAAGANPTEDNDLGGDVSGDTTDMTRLLHVGLTRTIRSEIVQMQHALLSVYGIEIFCSLLTHDPCGGGFRDPDIRKKHAGNIAQIRAPMHRPTLGFCEPSLEM